MTESYLTTDIVVIIVLIVVLSKCIPFLWKIFIGGFSIVVIGICAFFVHFYWTKIGVAEIWNTAKWSSMRSSFYRTIGRLSRASSSKYGSERPFSPASAYSEDTDGSALPAPLRNKKPNPPVHSPPVQPSTTATSPVTHHNVRRNSSNQIQPVNSITYNRSVKANSETKVGASPGNTRIQNDIETHRF